MPTEESRNTAIVIADNRETVLKAVTTTLEKAGFTVLPATNGAQALQYCQDNTHPVHLAIIDAAAAGINAADVEKQLEEVLPRIQTLFLANAAQEKTLRERADAPGHVRRFLHKPYRRVQLLGQVLEMMDSHLVLTA